jgi:rhodanese-related sulfurtransferase
MSPRSRARWSSHPSCRSYVTRRDRAGVDNAGGDATEGGESAGDALEVAHGAGEHLDDETVHTGDVVRFDDFRQRCDEVVKRFVVTGRVSQSHERGHVVAEDFGIDGYGVSRDHAAIGKAPNSFTRRAGGQVDEPSELRDAGASVLLQALNDRMIGRIEFQPWIRWHGPNSTGGPAASGGPDRWIALPLHGIPGFDIGMNLSITAVDFFAAKLAYETDPADLAAARASGTPPLVIDTRSLASWNQGRIPGAVHIPNADLASRIAEVAPDKEAEIVVYCWGPGCNGSTRGALILATLRYVKVRELIGGFEYWSREGLATVSETGRVRRDVDPLAAPVA